MLRTLQKDAQQVMAHSKGPIRGFSILELVIVIAVILGVTAITLPSLQNTLAVYKGSGAARNISAQLALARMRASAQFTRTRFRIGTTNQSFDLARLNKSTSAYEIEGGTLELPEGVTFGFGSIATPAGGQSVIGQTTEMYFNSRGMPVTSSGVPAGDVSAIYLTNDGKYYAVTVSIVGLAQVWEWNGTAWSQM